MDNKRTIMPNGRFTDDELRLFKDVFADNLLLLKILRKVMLELPMTKQEQTTFRKAFEGNEPLNDLMRKVFLPMVDGDVPLGQQLDLWLMVSLENKLPEEVKELIDSRMLTIQYLEAKLCELNGDKVVDHKSFKSFNFTNPVELKARNTIVAIVENQLIQINQLAGYKEETPEETAKRNQLNSSK